MCTRKPAAMCDGIFLRLSPTDSCRQVSLLCVRFDDKSMNSGTNSRAAPFCSRMIARRLTVSFPWWEHWVRAKRDEDAFHMKAIKAIQEQQAIIEDLQTQINEVKNGN